MKNKLIGIGILAFVFLFIIGSLYLAIGGGNIFTMVVIKFCITVVASAIMIFLGLSVAVGFSMLNGLTFKESLKMIFNL